MNSSPIARAYGLTYGTRISSVSLCSECFFVEHMEVNVTTQRDSGHKHDSTYSITGPFNSSKSGLIFPDESRGPLLFGIGTTSFWRLHQKKKRTIEYPNIPSALRPVSHGKGKPTDLSINSDEEDLHGSHNSPRVSTSACGDSKHVDDFSCFDETSSPHKINSVELNDLVRDLDLSKSKAEILASRLQQWNLLEENARVTSFRTCHLLFESFFKKEESLVFCCDIDGLLKELRIVYEPNK
ncbi:hypothetical protein AVEN_44900-1 [Araneus ventricosus]|uniref:Uncharacterized protein n=1 Tax=Araneus ventricosus TaxID=182803 RepID=A0A4Y2SK72_ARAVE|nr:hypothetical protein AVEN_44900-1 [Araneus ventricosus]